MKTLTVEHPSGELKHVLAVSRQGRVLVKHKGKPLALVIDVRHKDEEQIELENDPEFWRMIQERRSQPSVPWEQVKADLGIRTRPGKRQKKTSRARSATKGKRNAPA
jgi:hypothetical protein